MTGFWRRIALVVAVALLSAPPPCHAQGGDAQSGDQTIIHYGVEFPAAFADGQRFNPRDYESTKPGLGFSVAYRHRDAISTLYIYDLRQPAVPDDINAPQVLQQFEQANGDFRQVLPDGATAISTGTFTITDGRGRPRLKCQGYDLQRGAAEPRLDTFVCVGAVNGKFFKVRTTMPQQSGSQDELQRFIGAWAAKLWKS